MTAPIHAPKRVIALDWFDGAKSGLAEYEELGQVFHFQRVSSNASEPWAFVLRRSPLAHLSELDEILKPLGNPRLPVWAPAWRFQSERDKDRAEAAVSAAIPTSAPVVAVVIARRIEDAPKAARVVATSVERQAVESMERDVADVQTWKAFCETRPIEAT